MACERRAIVERLAHVRELIGLILFDQAFLTDFVPRFGAVAYLTCAHIK
jgi:hypothetical protein